MISDDMITDTFKLTIAFIISSSTSYAFVTKLSRCARDLKSMYFNANHIWPSADFFQKLGVTDCEGKPVHGKERRLGQCLEFPEIVGEQIDKALDARYDTHDDVALRVIDMGCGRGYVTFSLHSYLSHKYLKSMSRVNSVQTQGIDRGPLTLDNDKIARELGKDFDSLSFVEGKIGKKKNNLFDTDHDSDKSSIMDVLVALHVCDTSTDDAIWFGITRNVDMMILAPCCQQQLRPQIDRYASSIEKQYNNPLNDVLRHEEYRKLHAEMLTDAMRANMLEVAGYNVRIFAKKDVAKNVLIIAVRRQDDADEELVNKQSTLVSTAMMYGIKKHRLATLMGIQLDNNKRASAKALPRMPRI